MSTTELKSQIIDKINIIEDEFVLREILKLVNSEYDTDSSYKLSDHELKAIDRGLNDIREGKLYSSEVAENKIKQWLKK